MALKFYDAMTRSVCNSLQNVSFEVLGLSKQDKADKETGEIKKFTRFEIEVPRRIKTYSRTRFTVKVPDSGELPISEGELETAEYHVTFRNLAISYISSTHDVYFTADSFNIVSEPVIENDN